MMRILALAALALVAALSSERASAQPAFAWPSGHRAAIVLTYDDAIPSHLNVAIPQLDAAGLKGTFFLTGTFDQSLLPRWRAAAAEGHELGNHSIVHPCTRGSFDMPAHYNSETYDVGVMLTEIRVQNTLLTAIDGKSTHTFAMPCGQRTAGGQDYVEALRASGITPFARGIAPPTNDMRSIDLLYVPSTFFPETTTGADLIAWAESIRASGGLGVYGFHGVGGDYLTTSAEAHQVLVTYLAAHRDEYWVAPFGEVMAYIAAHRN